MTSPIPMPDDFRKMALQLNISDLAFHYRAHKRTVKRWLRECGIIPVSYQREPTPSRGWKEREEAIGLDTERETRRKCEEASRLYAIAWAECARKHGVAA
jgi:hypothetical protein